MTISPASVDILWEAPNSYTPAFYQGKALYPHEGELTFVALPNLERNRSNIDPKTLVYKWTLNGRVFADKSGYGKNTFSYKSDALDKPVTIKVEASSVNDNIVGEGTITVSSSDSKVYLYENNPLLGVLFNRAVQNPLNIEGSEINLIAYPYYFSSFSLSSNISYNWTINSTPLNLPPSQNSVIFRRPADAKGQSSVSVQAKSFASFLQTAEENLLINL
jgi:hypothetical protein